MNCTIRLATQKDAQICHDIYGSYVKGPDITFTIHNPSVEEYRQKIITTLKHYPFYIAEDSSGKVLGYCCGEPLRPHDAYKWNVEWTIVLAPDAPRRSGIATALYNQFAKTLMSQNFQFIYAVVVDTNFPSLEFHKSLGFNEVGHFEKAGIKNNRWLGIYWLSKYIGSGSTDIQEPVWFEELNRIK